MIRFVKLRVLLCLIAVLVACTSTSHAQVAFTYTVVSSGYETNSPRTTYTASGSPAVAAVDVNASAQFSVYNTLSQTKTAQTQLDADSGLEAGTPPTTVFDSGLTYYGVYSQSIAPTSYGSVTYTASVYASGNVSPGAYTAQAGFYIDDIKTGDWMSYTLSPVYVSVN